MLVFHIKCYSFICDGIVTPISDFFQVLLNRNLKIFQKSLLKKCLYISFVDPQGAYQPWFYMSTIKTLI